MRHVTRLLPLTLLVALLVPAGPSAQSSADEIIEKHLAATGGRAALGKLTSRRATGTVSIGTPAGDLGGPVEMLAKAPNKIRVHIAIDMSPMGMTDKMIVEQKFNGVAGWTVNSMQGDQPIEGTQLENMKHNVFPTPLLSYKTIGIKAEVLPSEQVSGKSLLVLKLTPPTGTAVQMYFDPETYLIVRQKMTVNVPQMGGDVEQISDLSDYRTVDGVKIPFQLVNSTSMQTITFKLDKVEHNVAIDDAIFSVKGLVR